VTGGLASIAGRPGAWLILFAAYFALQAGIRIMAGGPLNIDEAEAYLWAQALDWGYGPQPPLYIWLQGAVFAVTGPGVAGLAVLKGVLLFGIFAGVFAMLRRWWPVPVAGLATLALFWLPELAWESQRIRTHNVLATLIAVLLALWCLRARGTPGWAVGAGVLVGAGMLAKWNFALVAAGLAVALLGAPRGQRPGWRALPVAALVAGAMLVPTLLWMRAHPDVALGSMHKLGVGVDLGRAAKAGLFLQQLAGSLVNLLALPVLVVGGVALVLRVWRGTPAGVAGAAARGGMRVILLAAGVSLVLLLLAGLAAGMSQITTRWLLPLLVLVVPVVAGAVVARAGGRARAVWAGLAAAMMVALPVAMVRELGGATALPGVEMGAIAAGLPTDGVYVGNVTLVANLDLIRPDLTVADAALTRAQGCGAAVTMLSVPDAVAAPVLDDWIAACGLQPRAGGPDVPGLLAEVYAP
jgi:4-amino-4-deoxy-L-arabinose transferase-like glycosyltransferase